MKETFKYLGGLVLAVLLLWWVLRGTDPRVLWGQLREVSIPGLLLAAGLMYCAMFFRVWRWRALLEPVKVALPFRSMFVAVMLGYSISFTVPGRLGELIRPALLSGRERIPLGPCLGSVVADRLMDLLTVLVFFALGTLSTTLEGAAAEHLAVVRASSLSVLLVVGLSSILLLGLSSRRTALDRWLQRRRGRLVFFTRWILTLSHGTEALLRPRLLVRVTLYSVLTWAMISVGTWVGVNAAGARVSLQGILVIMPVLVLGIALPTPGGVGGYHAAMTLGLTQLFGIDYQLAVTVSFLLHVAGVVPVTLTGAVILFLDRGLLGDLRTLASQATSIGSSSESPPANDHGPDR